MNATTVPFSFAVFSDSSLDKKSIKKRYTTIRQFSEELCKPLLTEDYVIQSMPDVSPTKWHLAHCSWVIETFILKTALSSYVSPNPKYDYLFNSYYINVGDRFYRPERGLLSRPTVKEVYDYRAHVDEHFYKWIDKTNGNEMSDWIYLIELALHHEQQHQELLLTDIKHVFSKNPLYPVYHKRNDKASYNNSIPDLKWLPFPEGIYSIGHYEKGFSYDNENPRHRVFLEPFELADRLITNGEYLNFIEDGGYQDHNYWLSSGWDTIQSLGWKSPLYWELNNGSWQNFTLSGLEKVDENEPVCHVSYYEADAYAKWAESRLATEAELEIASNDISNNMKITGNFVDQKSFHPRPLSETGEEGIHQLFGDVWEWTKSHYSPYPGYVPDKGAVGEYNGKFMANQFVLKGGSFATSQSHIRSTYRNFFPADSRWQFTGIRLAKDLNK